MQKKVQSTNVKTPQPSSSIALTHLEHTQLRNIILQSWNEVAQIEKENIQKKPKKVASLKSIPKLTLNSTQTNIKKIKNDSNSPSISPIQGK